MRVCGDRFIFTVDLCFTAVAVVILTATLVAVEVQITGDHKLADIEAANGSPSGGIS
jgi:hypothetical protein